MGKKNRDEELTNSERNDTFKIIKIMLEIKAKLQGAQGRMD